MIYLCKILICFLFFRARGFFPVYNYVSSPSNAVSWGEYVKYGRMMKDCFSIQQSVWYYSVFLTKSTLLQEIAHFFLHRIPGIIIDKIAVWNGQKPRYTNNNFEKFVQTKSYFLKPFLGVVNRNVMKYVCRPALSYRK